MSAGSGGDAAIPEPWLRGPLPGLHPLPAAVLHTFDHAREDLAKYTAGLSTTQIWATPHGFGSVGFHIRHIGGSAGRLTTYLEGQALSEAQMTALNSENEPGETREELLADMSAAFRRAELVIRGVDPERLADLRTVGRKRLPTTVIGLLVHIAEHTARHVGQAISAAKWARAAES